MQTLRSLILLLLMSALASAANAHSVNAVDGYLDQAPAQLSLLSSQEYEGDEPDAASLGQPPTNTLATTPTYSIIVAFYSRANYADFLARAPPANL